MQQSLLSPLGPNYAVGNMVDRGGGGDLGIWLII
ncbi:MAG: hypothetical protein Pg6B_08110 [Candidatus Azobacteroides pseudotrichonymphae]|jgi:hypothetical protein|nr:MAG: hypothetical protein Pg6B_08110 [Candidatus Azobacteroides pseudotrichonymphae]